LNDFFIDDSIKSKFKNFRKIGAHFDMLEKPSMSRIL
jgi:hypothetical protein